jgi:apolipoprotein N-acyltransferase
VKPRVFAPAVLSGVLLWAAFFPLDLGALGFVALVPWLALVRAPVSNRRRYFAAYVGGVTFFALATQWVRVAHPMMYLSWLGLAVVMPLFWLVALALLRKLDQFRVPLAVAVPVAWVALEYCRMHFPTGFPFMKHLGAYQMIGFGWYFLGYTQHAFAQLIQIADLGGVYAVSFVVASVNGALAGAAIQLPAVRRLLKWEETQEPCCAKCHAVGGGIAAGLLCASIGYGFMKLDHAPFADGPLVAAIQGDVSQDDKMSRGGSLRQQYSKAHALAFRQNPRPDLIVWPETCYWEDWFEVTPGASRESASPDDQRQLLASEKAFDAYWGTHVLFGLSGHEWDGQRMWKYNSALLTDPTGRTFTRYDKMHLVPFGEYVPLGEQLPFMKWFTPYKHDYSCRPGERWTRFPLKAKDGRDYTFGCLICYEDSDPYLARQYVASEPVSFLVNISNDGWFNGTEEHEQHLAICRFRAVEARRSIVRSVNMGVSGVIDPDGRVVALPRPTLTDGKTVTLSEHAVTRWSAAKKMEGVALTAVPIDSRRSLYATVGDWIPALCWLTALAAVVLTWRKKPVAA